LGYEIDLVTMRLPPSVQIDDTPRVTLHQIDAERKDRIVCGAAEMMPYIVRCLFTSLRLIRAKRPDFNLSHFLLPDGIVCLLLKKLSGLPYAITAHGSDVPGYNPHRFKLLHLLLKPAWRVVARNANVIVCPSAVIQDLVRAECPAARTKVIPNGIDPGRFTPDRPKKPRILAVSRIVERKGVQYLIEALAGLDQPFELHVVGDGPYLPTLRELAARRQVDVVFHGAPERGLRRIEVSLPAADAGLIRRVARALKSNGDQAEQLRLAIERALPTKSAVTFKEWLAALPDDEEQ
jgi:glycosyltransferase involved in cell wall biosynthesis